MSMFGKKEEVPKKVVFIGTRCKCGHPPCIHLWGTGDLSNGACLVIDCT